MRYPHHPPRGSDHSSENNANRDQSAEYRIEESQSKHWKCLQKARGVGDANGPGHG